jgi:hypothetical protein
LLIARYLSHVPEGIRPFSEHVTAALAVMASRITVDQDREKNILDINAPRNRLTGRSGSD